MTRHAILYRRSVVGHEDVALDRQQFVQTLTLYCLNIIIIILYESVHVVSMMNNNHVMHSQLLRNMVDTILIHR